VRRCLTLSACKGAVLRGKAGPRSRRCVCGWLPAPRTPRPCAVLWSSRARRTGARTGSGAGPASDKNTQLWQRRGVVAEHGRGGAGAPSTDKSGTPRSLSAKRQNRQILADRLLGTPRLRPASDRNCLNLLQAVLGRCPDRNHHGACRTIVRQAPSSPSRRAQRPKRPPRCRTRT